MKSFEKLQHANIAEEEMLQLKAGEMEQVFFDGIDIDGIATNTNSFKSCRCGRGDLEQNNYNAAKHCKCLGTGSTTNDAVRCGNLITPSNPYLSLNTTASCYPTVANYQC